MDIILFTTDIQHSDVEKLSAVLDIPGVEKWTIDMEDCDHVLRIVGNGVCSEMLQRKLNGVGFRCQRMLDS